MPLPRFEEPLSPIVSVFGSVGLELVLVPDTVCEKLVELEDEELLDEELLEEELLDEELLDEELLDEELLELSLSPGQPWLMTRLTLPVPGSPV
jgi:hypothetical protein